MIWLAWRQFRTQAVAGAVALTALLAWIVVLGLLIRDAHETSVAGCTGPGCDQAVEQFLRNFQTPVYLTGILLIAVPAVVGVFWGAPLVARELETGTHRLVWTQGVTRRRWLAVRLGLVVLAGTAVAGILSLALTWAAGPFDQHEGTRFGLLVFDARNLAPLGYAAFAVVLGTATGVLLRRTVPAMAVTLLLFTAVQLAMPFLVRPHLVPPVVQSIALNASSREGVGLFLQGPPPENGEIPSSTPVMIDGYAIPGAWMLESTLPLLNADGEPADAAQVRQCLSPQGAKAEGGCLEALGLHFDVAYHPADRYWLFQGIETAAFLALSLLIVALTMARIRRIPA